MLDYETPTARVERYLQLSVVCCPCCDSVHPTRTPAGDSISPSDVDVNDRQEWEDAMEREEEWLRSNIDAVAAVLPQFESNWSKSIDVLRARIGN